MANNEVADLLERLAKLTTERTDAEQDTRHLFLYYEVVPGMISPSLYRISDNALTYVLTNGTIDKLVYELWQINEYGKRWQGMAMEIIGNRFTVTFDYPDGPYPPEGYSLEVSDDDDEEAGAAEVEAQNNRMMAAVRTRFGDRPIVYPTHEEVSRQMMLDNAASSADFDLEPPSSP